MGVRERKLNLLLLGWSDGGFRISVTKTPKLLFVAVGGILAVSTCPLKLHAVLNPYRSVQV